MPVVLPLVPVVLPLVPVVLPLVLVVLPLVPVVPVVLPLVPLVPVPGLGSYVSRIHSCRVRPYDILVKRVLEMALCLPIVKPAAVCFIFREEPFVPSIDEELEFSYIGVCDIDRLGISRGDVGS